MKADINKAQERNEFLASWWSKHNKKVVQELNAVTDQRDMARFIAALLGLAAVGFAVAVWIGKLIPVS